ncbi:MAG: UDP-3-O-(3-hydroxymyristoyl)glucosamine N-acyltransferase [Cellvibrionaceae bacterium]
MAASSFTLTLSEIAQHLDAVLLGDGSLVISSIATLNDASEGQISFLSSPSYKQYLSSTNATAVILKDEFVKDFTGSKLVVNDPYLSYAKLTQLFSSGSNCVSASIHKSAVVADDVVVGHHVNIGANAIVESGATLADHVSIGHGAVIGRNSTIGEGSVIHSNTVIYHDVVVGNHVLIHAGVVIGADGFGFAPEKNNDAEGFGLRWQKIHQLAGVTIGDDVEIGANSCIDRGALEDTVIESGVKLDNMVQIAHGVKIKKNTVIAGCTAVAGSTTIGENCMIAGGVGIVNQISIADNVIVTPMTLVTKSITKAGSYSSGTPMAKTAQWRKSAVRFGQLDELSRRLKDIEK